MPTENDNRYVLRREWEDKNKRIDENIRNNTNAINNLKSEFEKSTIYARQSYEVQKEMGTDIKELTKELREQSKEYLNLSHMVKNHEASIKGIKGTIDEKQKGSVQIIASIITVSGVALTVAGTLLTHFF